MNQPALVLVFVSLMMSACRPQQPDGADVIAAVCKDRDRFTPGMTLPGSGDLWNDVQGLEYPDSAHRFTSTYEATSNAAAMRLAAWWRTQDSLDVVIDSILPSTPEEVEAILATGVVGLEIGCDPIWSVHIRTYPAIPNKDRVMAWSTMLQSVPIDSTWRLAGLGISGP